MTSPLKWRLNVDEEFQGWILLFATLFAINVFCLPCQWAGSSWSWKRGCANRVQRHLPIYLVSAAIVNAGFLFLVVTWMPDWEPSDYLKCVAKTVQFLAKNFVKMAVSIAIITVGIILLSFKDRIMKVIGIDEKNIFRFKFRDIFGGGNLRAIELQILKVDGLPNKNPFVANNVFIETKLGYNEAMKTRVHNNVGVGCTFKENIQLNFDEDEEEEELLIVVKSQKVVGAEELSRLTLLPKDIVKIEKECGKGSQGWNPSAFVERSLESTSGEGGKIYFRIQEVEDEDARALMC